MDKGNNDNDTSGRQDEAKLIIDNKSMRKTTDPGKIHNNIFTRTECAKAECTFDDARVCIIMMKGFNVNKFFQFLED